MKSIFMHTLEGQPMEAVILTRNTFLEGSRAGNAILNGRKEANIGNGYKCEK
jgi:hypothetical protein